RCNFAPNGYYYNLDNLNSQYPKVANRCNFAPNGYYRMSPNDLEKPAITSSISMQNSIQAISTMHPGLVTHC
ncbi:hypothetical protein, partial [Gardnerella vaginalis]|uniref:hypothetical protein n=1 Tax=Gardnerella vaginalis TaxID=2702 RepID=UPI001E572340